MSPLPKVPVQGDSSRIAQVASGLKQQGGSYGPTVQRNPTGRPPGSTGTPGPQQGAPDVLRPEHKQVFDELAQAELDRQRWSQVAKTSPTPWVQGMQQLAEQNYQAIAAKAYNVIPNMGF